jgi:hypothetical protein
MLQDFFKLNSPFQEFDEQRLTNHFDTSKDLQNVLYAPDVWASGLKGINGVTFKNVSFSKTVICEVTFTNCIFEDSLFIGTNFREVQFHNCAFINCNFYKADVVECYLNPESIRFDNQYKKTAANIGVYFFQKLLENSSKTKQPFFEIDADIKFRQWKRAQLFYDYRKEKINTAQLALNFARSLSYEVICGFGYRPLRFAIVTTILFITIALINFWTLTDGLSVNGVAVRRLDIVDSIFYTFSILTVLGFSSIVPNGSFAKIATVFEALAGVGWMGVFTSLLVKRFLK